MGRTDNQVASSSKAAAVNSRSNANTSKGRGSRDKAKKTPASTSSQNVLPTDDTDNQQLVASITKQVLEQLNSRSTRRPSSPDSSDDELEEESEHPGRTRGRKRTRVTPKKSRKRHRHKSPRGTPSGSDSDISNSSDSSECSSESGSSSESDEDSSGFSGSRTRISSTIASQIDQKLKNKIWQRKYINLAKLLPQYKDTSAYGESIHLQSTGRSQFRLLKKKSASTIRTIDQWTSAFLRYVAIYAEKFPKEIPHVIKHGEIVRDLAARKTGDAWFIYDQRVRAEIEVSDFPWGQLHHEFWVMANTPYQNYSNSSQPFRGKGAGGFRGRSGRFARQGPDKVPQGFCYSLHKHGKCPSHPGSCPYKHWCYQCKKTHSVLYCQGNKANTNTSQPNQIQTSKK